MPLLATLANAWPALAFAVGVFAIIGGIDFAIYRAVRRLELLVKVLAAMAATVITMLGLGFGGTLALVGVWAALCPPDAFECPF